MLSSYTKISFFHPEWNEGSGGFDIEAGCSSESNESSAGESKLISSSRSSITWVSVNAVGGRNGSETVIGPEPKIQIILREGLFQFTDEIQTGIVASRKEMRDIGRLDAETDGKFGGGQIFGSDDMGDPILHFFVFHFSILLKISIFTLFSVDKSKYLSVTKHHSRKFIFVNQIKTHNIL